MKFHLNYTPPKASFQISHKDSLLLTGSCFTENIGSLLRDSKFNAIVNPGGILFNPSSIYNFLNSALKNEKTNEDLILERQGKFYSYLHHSSFSAPSKNGLTKKINAEILDTHHFLKNATTLFITFGTAFIYKHKKLNQTVANCHKQPSDIFTKELLDTHQIVDPYTNLIQEIRQVNPSIKIIFTVSPVKHLKDSLELNTISKSTLLLSVHKLTAQIKDCFYFPAFELVNDDLRDYRFYKEDLAHPNDQAIQYIWNKFSDCFFNEQTQQINLLLEGLNKVLSHQPMTDNDPAEAQLKEYIDKQKAKIHALIPGLTL